MEQARNRPPTSALMTWTSAMIQAIKTPDATAATTG